MTLKKDPHQPSDNRHDHATGDSAHLASVFAFSDRRSQGDELTEMDLKECMKTLELESLRSPDEVKQAYRDLVQIWHPERFPNNSRIKCKAKKKLRETNIAYEKIMLHLSSDHDQDRQLHLQSQSAGKTEIRIKKAEPQDIADPIYEATTTESADRNAQFPLTGRPKSRVKIGVAVVIKFLTFGSLRL